MMNIHKELPLSFPGCPPSPDPSPPFTQISRHYREHCVTHELDDAPTTRLDLFTGETLKLLDDGNSSVLVARGELAVVDDVGEPDGGQSARTLLRHRLKMWLRSANRDRRHAGFAQLTLDAVLAL